MDKKNSLYIVSFMTGICLIFGLGVSVVYNATTDMLKKNEALHKNRILCNAFMLEVEDSAESYERAVRDNLEFRKFNDGSSIREFYKLLDSEKDFIGFNFSGMGFWDKIVGIVVLTKDLKRIINVKFFEQKETPGLGARIEEEWFTDQFKEFIIPWDNSVLNRVIIKSASGVCKDNEVDAIAGATQTSMAIKRILNSELENIRKLVLIQRINGG